MDDKESNIKAELEPSRGDNIHSATVVGLGMLPVIGPFAAAFFERAVAAPVARRQSNLLIDIYEHLKEIERKVEEFRIDNLDKNEAFASQVMQVLQIALTTSEKEHLEALRNSALNVAIEESSEEAQRKVFTQWLSELTHWHWKILRVFDDTRVAGLSLNLGNSEWVSNIALTELHNLIEETYPEMRGQFDFSIHIIRDLYARGLISNRFPSHDRLSRRTNHPELTTTARDFLAFVTHPLETS